MVELYTYQKTANALLKMNDSFALFMDQGTGKTITMLHHLSYLIEKGKVKTCLIICPKAVMGSWERDIEKFDNKDSLNEVITVINYDKVWRTDKYYHEWDCVVLDESHFIKNRGARRSKFILRLATKSQYRYILTGTPIGNSQLENLWSQYVFLYPVMNRGNVKSKIFGTYYEFLDKYCYLNQYYQPYKYHNVDDFQEIMNEHCFRITKEECLDLPDKLPDEIYEISLQNKQLYKDLIKNSVIKKYDFVADNPLVKRLKARQMLSGYIQVGDEIEEIKCEKQKALVEFLDNWNKKLVIFAQFTHSIDVICKTLKDLKIKYITLDGRQKNKSIWRDFQSDDSIQVIVCQYESANAGVDLYAADTILYYEPTERSVTLEQSRDRIHRIGQTHKCSYIHFITKGTVEEAIYKTLQKHCDFSDDLFNEYIKEYTKSYAIKRGGES